MKSVYTRFKRVAAVLMALAMLTVLAPITGRAAQPGVYFTAANDELLPLDGETMPFWSNGVLYVSSRFFENTDLGVSYVRSASTGLAMLYTAQVDLRFDLAQQTTHDKQGNIYSGYAIDRGGVVYFPLSLVCRFFSLEWSYTETELVPLIRVTSASVILDDASFIDAAATLMSSRYHAYIKSVTPPDPPPEDQPIQAAEDQKIYLIVDCAGTEDVRGLLDRLDGVQATFLLTAEQMEDADLLRGLVSGGYGVALRLAGGTEDEVRREIRRGRELLWDACCCWLELVWYESEYHAVPQDSLAELLEEAACVRVTARLNWRGNGLEGAGQANTLLRTIGRYREDLSVCLAGRQGLAGLETLLRGLEEGQYRLCAWRLTA